MPTNQDPTNSLDVGGARALRVTRDGGVTTLALGPIGGPVEIEIVIGVAGPVVRVHAAQLELTTRGPLALSCEDFHLHARGNIELRAEGDLRQLVAGDLECVAAGDVRLDGKAMRARARRGELRLEAHDDVRIDGEKVLLNS